MLTVADILLYLMACRERGYFTLAVGSAPFNFRAYQLVLPSWTGYVAGLVNFQNPRAVVNTGSLLEVLMKAAVSSAAGTASVSVPRGFEFFIVEFGAELGVETRWQYFASDQILSKITIPKFIFPGKYHLLSKNEYLKGLDGILGTVERRHNSEGFSLILQAIGSSPADSVRFEARDQDEFRTSDLVDSARRLMEGSSNVGVLVLRRCKLPIGAAVLRDQRRLI